MHGAGGLIVYDPPIKRHIVHFEGNFDTMMGLPKELTRKLIEEVS
jgi:hypothetical protein